MARECSSAHCSTDATATRAASGLVMHVTSARMGIANQTALYVTTSSVRVVTPEQLGDSLDRLALPCEVELTQRLQRRREREENRGDEREHCRHNAAVAPLDAREGSRYARIHDERRCSIFTSR